MTDIKTILIVQSPLQQGLKLIIIILVIVFFLLIVQSPLQQGLKQKSSAYKYRKLMNLIVQSPLQQGLKQKIIEIFSKNNKNLIVQSPLQQGLKPYGRPRLQIKNTSYRTKSITTRIETDVQCA